MKRSGINFGWLYLLALFMLSTNNSVWAGELTTAEKQYLKEKGTIVFVSQTKYPPFEFIDANGQHEGMMLDIIRGIAVEVGFKPLFLDMTFQQAQEAVLSGKADIITSLFYSDKRNEKFEFTDPLFNVPASIFMKVERTDIKDIKDLNGKMIAMPWGDYAKEFLESKKAYFFTLITKDFAEATSRVVDGDADVVIGDEQVVYYHIFSNRLTGSMKKVGEPLYIGKNCMASNQNNAILIGILNKGINEAIRSGRLDKITTKWLGTTITSPEKSFLDRYRWQIAVGASAILSFLLLIWVWNVRLRILVQKKTADITIREAELRESEEQFRSLAESSHDYIVRYDRQCRNIYLNPAAMAIVGLTEADIIGKIGLASGFSEDQNRRWEENITQVFATAQPYQVEISWKGVTGLVYLDWRLTPEFDVEGHVHSVLGVARDITARKMAETERELLQAQLIQAQKMEAIGTLAGGIAHDFNNILGAMLGYAEMVWEDSPEGSQAAKDLDQVLLAGNRAKDLVKQILAFSRQTEEEKIPLQPAAIVNETIKLLRSSIPSTITIKQDVNMVCGLILADPTQLHQILMNLCTNAFHAMEENGGTLAISLNSKALNQNDLLHEPQLKPGNYIELSIEDTGTGIEPEVQKKIFDPYFTTKKTGKGTGMGLAITHGIVKSYDGFIACESQVGVGTIFHIYLPSYESDTIPGTVSSEYLPVIGTERILFVDDEPMLAQMGRTMLERLGYAVTVRTSSQEALTTFSDQPDAFDLVITDQTMPELTGFDLAQLILQIRPNLPIILCTGYSSVISEEQVKSSGIRGYALKPVSKQNIVNLIRTLLDEKREVVASAN